MSGLGLFEGNLIVAIEEPHKRSPSYMSGVSYTSVNISGPIRYIEERGYDLGSFIVIDE